MKQVLSVLTRSINVGVFALSMAFIIPIKSADKKLILSPLSHATIEKKAIDIDIMTKRHRIMFIGLNGVLLSNELIQLARLTKSYFSSNNYLPPQPISLAPDIKKIPAVGVPISISDKIKLGARAIKDSFVSGSIVKLAFSTMRELGIYVATDAIVRSLLKKISHNNNISWYVKKVAPFNEKFVIADEYVALMLLDEKQKDISYYENALKSVCVQLAEDIHNIIAFMEHKIKILIPENVAATRLLIEFVFNHTNVWIEDMNTLFMAESLDPVLIQKRLIEFKTDLILEFKRFAGLEQKVLKTPLFLLFG